MRGIRIFLNTLREGIKGVWQNRSMGFASIVSIFAVLSILGFVMISAVSMNTLINDIGSNVDEISVFIKEDVKEDARAKVENELRNIPNVKSVEFRNKQVAYEDFKNILGDDAYIIEGYEEALPESFILKIEDIKESDKVVQKAKDIEGVEKVRYNQEIIQKISKLSKYAYYGGITITLVLALISLFVISNTVKLTVFARRKEIGIKKYVGANNATISSPFIIEGLIFGFIGSIISFVVVYGGYRYLYKRYANNFLGLFSTYLTDPSLIRNYILLIFLVLGMGIGVLGSMYSVRKHLRV